MSLRRTLAVAAVALCGAAVTSAQVPGLRPVVTQPVQPVQTQQRGVRPVATVSPVPIIVLQQQQALQAAYNNALLWQMTQPPVVVVNPFPPLPYREPMCSTPDWMNGRFPFAPQPGAFGNSTNVFYRGNALNWANPYGPHRLIR